MELGPRTMRPTGINGSITLDLIYSLGLESKVRCVPKNHPSAKNRYIALNGSVHTILDALKLMMPGVGMWVRPLFAEIFNSKRSYVTSESVDTFVTRRWGPHVSNLVSAFINGIYATDHSKLEIESVAFAFLKKYELEYGSVTFGILLDYILKSLRIRHTETFSEWSSDEARKFAANVQLNSVYAFDGGMQTLSDTLLNNIKEIGVDVVKNKCINIGNDGEYYYIQLESNPKEKLYAHHIVCANPSYSVSPLVSKISPQLSQLLSNIPWVDVAVVNLTYNGKSLVRPGFGFLAPKSENSDILGVIFDSCVLESEDQGRNISRFTVLLPGNKCINTESGSFKSNEEILLMALNSVDKYLGLNSKTSTLLESNVVMNEKCIPEYILGHQKLISNIDKLVEELKVISLIGSSYRGVSINDVIANSRNEALKIVSRLS